MADHKETSDDIAHRLMCEAVLANKGLPDPAIDAFIKALLAENDAVLLWDLFAEVRMPVIRKLFGTVVHQLRAQQRAANASQPQSSIARSSTDGDRGQSSLDTRSSGAPAPSVGGAASSATA
jgi:hypothetical protein